MKLNFGHVSNYYLIDGTYYLLAYHKIIISFHVSLNDPVTVIKFVCPLKITF